LEFEYDWQGRRIKKKVTNLDTNSVLLDNKFLYDGWNLIAELNATNNVVIHSYMWGLDLSGSVQGAGGVGGLLLLTCHSSPVTRHFAAYDGNGNVAALVKATDGTISAQYEYGPFAEPIRVTGSMGKTNPIRFSTKYTDDESDFLNYGHRYYNPSTGRWLNRDPIVELDAANMYVLVYNNPATFWDGFGLFGGPAMCYMHQFENSPGSPFGPSDSFWPHECPYCHKRRSNVFHNEAWYEQRFPGTLNSATNYFQSQINALKDQLCKGEFRHNIGRFTVNEAEVINYGDKPPMGIEPWLQLGNHWFELNSLKVCGSCCGRKWEAAVVLKDRIGVQWSDVSYNFKSRAANLITCPFRCALFAATRPALGGPRVVVRGSWRIYGSINCCGVARSGW
jgi:RHS repeat-associated protein